MGDRGADPGPPRGVLPAAGLLALAGGCLYVGEYIQLSYSDEVNSTWPETSAVLGWCALAALVAALAVAIRSGSAARGLVGLVLCVVAVGWVVGTIVDEELKFVSEPEAAGLFLQVATFVVGLLMLAAAIDREDVGGTMRTVRALARGVAFVLCGASLAFAIGWFYYGATGQCGQPCEFRGLYALSWAIWGLVISTVVAVVRAWAGAARH